jgi:hypothetical protein
VKDTSIAERLPLYQLEMTVVKDFISFNPVFELRKQSSGFLRHMFGKNTSKEGTALFFSVISS